MDYNYNESTYNRACEQRSAWRASNRNITAGTKRAVRSATDSEFDADAAIEAEESKADAAIDAERDAG